MSYFVYVIKCTSPGIKKTYVGYSIDVEKRLIKHNSNKGAKSTRGHKWKLIYKQKFKNKNDAMSYEYKIKNNKSLRKNIIENFSK
ncbi:GIY-YIG nuclease family protein [Candidatus Pelagibacter sp. HIMB1593]|uniref:GIY-YIG nuclease family protein n=1 Tax=Candidatus Pelagibacter sp. HIMB1593 TaxID=3413355 RepID=UPI003F83A229